jgi:hypothetical protein
LELDWVVKGVMAADPFAGKEKAGLFRSVPKCIRAETDQSNDSVASARVGFGKGKPRTLENRGARHPASLEVIVIDHVEKPAQDKRLEFEFSLPVDSPGGSSAPT